MDESSAAKRDPTAGFAPRCLSIDLEVGIRDGRIHSFAAVRGDTGTVFVYRQGNLAKALVELDEFASGLTFLLGHNIVAFDHPHLAATKPDLQLLRLPMVDTLRLSPLAFPRNPYHRLVKHYQDGQLKRGRLNDPELDARLTLQLFRDQLRALQATDATNPDLLRAWHWLGTVDSRISGLNSFFTTLRRQRRPTDEESWAAIERLLAGQACEIRLAALRAGMSKQAWDWCYALAWLSVTGSGSVMPGWVRKQFPGAGGLVEQLRDAPCGRRDCSWCSRHHDARSQLKRWFGAALEFRAEPADSSTGLPLQQLIVEAAMRRRHVLGILPTGTGKSLCYQIPALSRFDKTGALTVVISPLVALMADQVNGLLARGHLCSAAINGLLSMPERADVLDRVRLGEIGILIMAPEQLRSRSVRKVLAQREIGAWVLDEAHCLSKWGHDFRPDYRYVGRFIGERAGDQPIPPILCLTATAKLDVIADILAYFRVRLQLEFEVHDGGASRNNLSFDVQATNAASRFEQVWQLLEEHLPADVPGGAIVYCSTRRRTEEVAEFLQLKDMAAGYFHAGLAPESKKGVQERFINGDLRVIGATNAFGMGIDKPDVRLVIHADLPGSLENYVQEAGRAGRDRQQAHCVLLFAQEDIERQFGLSARSRLSQRDIQAILRALRQLDRKKRYGGEVVAISGEILAEDTEHVIERDQHTDDTRVRTALSWLEEAELLTREENRVQVFPSSLRVGSMQEAEQRLAGLAIAHEYRQQLLALVAALADADADEGISTDELMLACKLESAQLRTALFDLERLGIASNDTALTAFVHAGVAHSSVEHLQLASALEIGLIAELRELAPDFDVGQASILNLRTASQRLKDAGHAEVLPERLHKLLKGLAGDGRSEDSGIGSLRLRRVDAESLEVRLQRPWQALQRTAELRHRGAYLLLEHLLASLPAGLRGKDLLAETTLGKLLAALQADLLLKAQIKDPPKLLDRSLLWLHELDIVRLNRGLTVFRSAMTLRLAQERRSFVKSDFEPLRQHYAEQVGQIHVMAEYARRAMQAVNDAMRLVSDYFRLSRLTFLQRWLPEREKELQRQTSPESWRQIVESLNNTVQQRIVADDREQTNVLVLAGPGSGKTRVLVHRIAWLLRVRRELPSGILALAYNHHAAIDIRRRLRTLLGDDSRGVTVMTCHALAMRLTGASFSNHKGKVGDEAFRIVLAEAIALLKGEGLPPDEADEQRDRLLAGFRWILVDEYQDIGPEQYELIAALAGRNQIEEDARLTLFAVGDDDQNIYAFAGASVEYIRRFESDYQARPAWLVENYRSTAHIVAAANQVIARASQRLKTDHPIVVDRLRRSDPPGGAWQALDQVGTGRVQIIQAGKTPALQAYAAMVELERLAACSPDWQWQRLAVIAREWRYLENLRSYCEYQRIPVQLADEDGLPFLWLRETQALVDWLSLHPATLIDAATISAWLGQQTPGPHQDLLLEAVSNYQLETGGAELPTRHFQYWLAEWGREVRRRQSGLLLLTAHRAKGLEFDHVVVLDGGWERHGATEDVDAARRLYYVAMTRARASLTLASMVGANPFIAELQGSESVLARPATLLPEPPNELHHVHRRLEMGDVDLGFAGRHASGHAVHRAIRALIPGSALQLHWQQQRWHLRDSNGTVVGRLAQACRLPASMTCVRAQVGAVIVRLREQSPVEYQGLLRCGRWETILPELVFEPTST